MFQRPHQDRDQRPGGPQCLHHSTDSDHSAVGPYLGRKYTSNPNLTPISFFICLALLLFAQPLFAHRSPEGITTIERNPNTGTIEVVHRLHLHDAEYTLAQKYPDSNLTLDSLKGKARLALDVESSFQIIDLETEIQLNLVLIGAELEGDYILVFQELAGEFPHKFRMRHDALRETFPEQVNTVNFKRGPKIRTIVFDGDPKWQSLEW